MRKFLIGAVGLVLLNGLTFAQEKPRVFVTDSQSWEVSSGGGGADGAFGTAGRGGARPQTAEIVKTFGERCPNVTINNIRQKADYVVVLDHEGGKGGLLRDNKIAIFNPEGDSIFSRSTRSLGNAVQDACKQITQDWSDHKYAKTLAAKSTDSIAAAPEMNARIALASDPAGADVEIDGAYVGSTPSNIHLTPGEHAVSIKKKGYQPWEKKIRITSGEVSVNAELEKM